MYGMAHRALRQMMIDRLGPAAWAKVERETATGPADLISLCVYDDSKTIALIAASADKLGLSFDDALRVFGRYWVQFAELSSFGPIMDFTGQDIVTFINNLDRMHRSVVLAMPDARVPSFTLLDETRQNLRVRYRSDRTGLEAFVIGLLEGLLDRMNEKGTVEVMARAGNTIDFAIHLDRN
ncbi:heme NO-binding domain-containing protein [Novosphingobium fuchskuhlense]|nr:heme NO-binding domain-containing protein [Novosphingobium fuchskuhlense]